MSKIHAFVFLLIIFLSGCKDETTLSSSVSSEGVEFQLRPVGYEGAQEGAEEMSRSGNGYDALHLLLLDGTGRPVQGVKWSYDRSVSSLRLEGLHEGSYRLQIVGIRGNASHDGLQVNDQAGGDEVWLTFSGAARPLEAEYYYSSTPLDVTVSGGREQVSISGEVIQRPLCGRLAFGFAFASTDVERTVSERRASLQGLSLASSFSASGEWSGYGEPASLELALDSVTAFRFLPTDPDLSAEGNVKVETHHFLGMRTRLDYPFGLDPLETGVSVPVMTNVVHPDDRQAAVYVAAADLPTVYTRRILSDDEPWEVYTDQSQRRFNTASPLQAWIDGEGWLRMRFYSPRGLGKVTVRASFPGKAEEIDIAYLDSVPPFIDLERKLPLAERTALCRTAEGKLMEWGPVDPSLLAQAKISLHSDDPYWAKLGEIRHGWNIYWGLYGGDPTRPDGGPVGNWMGIRPVHCRESIALFLNFTYMIDTPEHEQILRENEDILYGNGGPTDKVTAETVLAQMRQSRTLCVGLVYPGNGIVGLGGGSTFGAYQQAWLQHYWNAYSCEIMFHELGHVMGYSHSSSFTYGPWAQQLMNHFYVDHLKDFPIDSPHYLESSSNATLYR